MGYNCLMETVVHNIGNLSSEERSAAEQLVGHALRDNQQVIIQVMTIGAQLEEEPTPERSQATSALALPDYCNVYDGLSDEEVAELESLILERSRSRSTS